MYWIENLGKPTSGSLEDTGNYRRTNLSLVNEE
jgi:hypothetical protein